jgi:hypothetical protein
MTEDYLLHEQSLRLKKSILYSNYREIKDKQHPHPNLRNFHTIKWFRQRLTSNAIKRGVMKLLPNNGAPVEEEETDIQKVRKKKREIFLQNYLKKDDKFQNILITPSYLYSPLVLSKIFKLKTIFLEFDSDLSSRYI